MTVIDAKKWKDIRPPKDLNTIDRLRANAEHPLDFWIAKDHQGRYIFFFDSPTKPPDKKLLPKVSGIEINVNKISEQRTQLILTLLDSEQFDIFCTLCGDLVTSTSRLERHDTAANLTVVLQRIKRWQLLLEKARDKGLSQSEIIGLIGELLFLRDILIPNMNAHKSVEAWRGPFGDEQDFLVGGIIIEIKTQMSTSDQYLQISSESQLDISSGRIVLCHQTIDIPSSEIKGGVSLNQVVKELAEYFGQTDTSAYDLFQANLLEAGYLSKDLYDKPVCIINNRKFFEVTENFPCITPKDLSEGISKVRYRIDVNSCEDFLITKEKFLKEINNGS